MSDDLKNKIKSHQQQQFRLKRISSGASSNMFSGHYGIDLSATPNAYFIGDTRIYYLTKCNESFCTTTFTSSGDGFWDPLIDMDGLGPKGEYDGTPYSFNSFSWTEIFWSPLWRL